MRLTETARTQINTLPIRLKLATVLKFSETWIRESIHKNKDNGPLTLAAAIKVIKKETGLKESEILEEVTEPERVAA